MTLAKSFYIIADTHFYHRMMENRGWRPVGFTEMIVDNWKNRIGDDDWVFILGDVCFDYKKCRKLIPELPGRKILVKGNHDHWNRGRLMKLGFEFIESDMVFVQYRISSRRVYYFVLSHYYHSKKELMDRLPVKNFILLYGHSHKKRKFIDKSVPAVNVCAEWLDYSPISSDEVLALLRPQSL